MTEYNVLVGFDCNVSIEVEADSPEEARDKAQAEASVSLCHQCARDVNMNDQTYVIVESDGANVLEEGPEDDAEQRGFANGLATAATWVESRATIPKNRDGMVALATRIRALVKR